MACRPLPAIGGDSKYSYAFYSSIQKGGVEAAKSLIRDAIIEKLDVEQILSSSTATATLKIVDLGCSIGPNTFVTVQNIVESINLKFRSEKPEIQVFFNDFASNDFNTLFRSLPSNRQYYAAGVPGDFHGRLFPKSSVHFINCFYALHWLTKVPKEVVDRDSPAWNKGSIDYANSPRESRVAFATQFARDMDLFLDAREEELACGGLMAIVMPCVPDGSTPSQCLFPTLNRVLAGCLREMANEGILSEDKVDSFNLPRYHATKQELAAIIGKHASLSIEKMEFLDPPNTLTELMNPSVISAHLRTTVEASINDHFGDGIVDELFRRHEKKVAEFSIITDASFNTTADIFLLLKCRFT